MGVEVLTPFPVLWYFLIYPRIGDSEYTLNLRWCGMLYRVGSSLPEYRLKACIDTTNSNNRMQDNGYARRYGFSAGLVPGISVFSYMSRTVVEFLGRDWLERGYAEVRFIHPVYEGEDIHITGSVSSITDEGALLLDYQASNSQGATCGIGIAQLPPKAPTPEPSLSDYPPGHAKLHRPLYLESLNVGERLTPIKSDFTWNIHWQYCQKSIRDHHPLYQKVLHPGWLVSRASRILDANYTIQAWIDVASQIQIFNIQEVECTVETRGRVLAKYQREENHFIVLDLAVFSKKRCLATIRYTAIFRIAPIAA